MSDYTDPPTLEYVAMDCAASRPIWPSLKLGGTIVFYAAILTAISRATPRLQAWINSQPMQMPTITRMWIFASHQFNLWGWVVLWLAVGLIVLRIVMLRPAVLSDPAARSERALIRIVVLAIFGLPMVWGIFAAVLPYFSLIEQLSSPRTG